jgi:uncharacterized cupin superfamily protein
MDMDSRKYPFRRGYTLETPAGIGDTLARSRTGANRQMGEILMSKIVITKPSEHALDELGVKTWDVWACDVSTFGWHFDQRETCYILEGSVTVTSGDEKVTIGSGDLVVFPEGMDCTWAVSSPVKKRYKFG